MSNYIYGKNSFFEALKSGRILMAYVQDDRLIKDKGIPYKVVDRKKLDGLCRGGNHQGYVAEVKDFKLSAVDEMVKERNGLIVMLDGLEDVHNLGAIIRTAETAGAAVAEMVLRGDHEAVFGKEGREFVVALAVLCPAVRQLNDRLRFFD